jgi:putative FmdB family regulatory protein
MPLYDYQCRSCKTVTEVRHGFRDVHEGVCPACGGELARVFNPAGILFKGSGFYVNDSRKSADAGAGSSSPSPSASSEGSAAAAPAASSEGGSSKKAETPKKSENAA